VLLTIDSFWFRIGIRYVLLRIWHKFSGSITCKEYMV